MHVPDLSQQTQKSKRVRERDDLTNRLKARATIRGKLVVVIYQPEVQPQHFILYITHQASLSECCHVKANSLPATEKNPAR